MRLDDRDDAIEAVARAIYALDAVVMRLLPFDEYESPPPGFIDLKARAIVQARVAVEAIAALPRSPEKADGE